ncbi:MAG: hypothetical protein R2755_30490 [Acidimicrobiales bacterium]
MPFTNTKCTSGNSAATAAPASANCPPSPITTFGFCEARFRNASWALATCTFSWKITSTPSGSAPAIRPS